MTLRSCSSLMSSCSLPESTNELSKEWSGQGTSGDWTSVSQPRCTGRVRGGAEVEWTTATALVWGMGELAIWYISQASKSWGDEKKDERYLPGRQQQWLLPPLLLPDGILAELSVSGASISLPTGTRLCCLHHVLHLEDLQCYHGNSFCLSIGETVS